MAWGSGTTPDQGHSDPALESVVQVAVADLAARIGGDPDAIEVLKAERVTWPNGALGCPQPGMMYTEALVGGFQVVLATDHRTRVFDYHAGADERPFLCPSAEKDGGHDFVPPPGMPI